MPPVPPGRMVELDDQATGPLYKVPSIAPGPYGMSEFARLLYCNAWGTLVLLGYRWTTRADLAPGTRPSVQKTGDRPI